MISERILNIINEQINREFYSGYLYLSISAYFRENGLFGFAHRTKEQAAEEMEHGMKLYEFIIDRDGRVELKNINSPIFETGTPLEIYQKIYELLGDCEIAELSGIEPNPKITSVREGVKICKEKGIEVTDIAGGAKWKRL